MASQSLPLPHHLERAPIAEAIFEVRFEPLKPSAGDLLPGILYDALSPQFAQVEQLPAARVPREIRETQEALKYVPSSRLLGDTGVLAIGDRSVQFGSKGGYPGWEGFNDSVLQVLESLRQTGFAGNVERFSLKAINLFDGEAGAQLDVLNAKAELAGRRVPEFGFRMRAEFSEGADVGIVDIATNATLTMPAGDQRTGLLLDVDCVRTRGDSDFWASAAREVDELHHFQKKLFFSLLTDQTLSGLGPVYEDT